MVLSLQSLAHNILLDSLQPMARQSSKTVEANIHMLVDHMMIIAGDPRMGTVEVSYPDAASTAENRRVLLVESAEIYELYIISLYDLDGQLVQGIDGVPESLDIQFFTLLKETDNASRRPTNRSLSSVMNDISTNHSINHKNHKGYRRYYVPDPYPGPQRLCGGGPGRRGKKGGCSCNQWR